MNKLYIWSEKELGFVRVDWLKRAVYGAAVIVVFVTALLLFSGAEERITEQRIIAVITKRDAFSENRLVERIKGMNFKYPYIVYAQAILETNRFKSPLFYENNNLFGMKQAVFRLSVALGIRNEHAYYNSWTDSLYDYGLYYATYLSKLSDEEDYYSFLSGYAEDEEYVTKLKKLILEENIKSMFN